MAKPTQEQIAEWIQTSDGLDLCIETAYAAGMEAAAKQLRDYAAEHSGTAKAWAEKFADMLEAQTQKDPDSTT